MTNEHSDDRQAVYYGWIIVAVATLALIISNGLSIGGIPVFYKSIREDFVASGAVAANHAESFITFGASLTFFFSGVISPLAGWLIPKFPLKKLMLAGCVMLGGGLIIHAFATSVPTIYAARILMGISLGFVGVLPTVVLVSRWFPDRRGTAIGILLSGTSFGGVVIPPLATPLIEAYGWRTAMVLVSLIVWLLLAPAILFFVKDHPEEIAASTIDTADESAGVPFRQAIRTPLFWLLAFAAALIFYPIFVTSQQLILQTAKIGFTPWQSTFVQSGLFAFSVFGKFLFGYLSDNFRPVRVALICTITMFASTWLLLSLNATTALLFLIPFGLGYGGAFVIIQRLVADFFGERDYSKILGAITMGEILGAVLGGTITAQLADRFGGDYTVGFYGVIVATGAALALMLALNFSRSIRRDHADSRL